MLLLGALAWSSQGPIAHPGALSPPVPTASVGAARAQAPSATAGLDWWTGSVPSGLSFQGRAGAAVATDPGAGLTLLFGGFNKTTSAPTYLGDTWVFWYANLSYHQVGTVPGKAPSPRSDAAMVWDATAGGTGAFVLFGGVVSAGTYANDTWWFYPGNFTWRLPYLSGWAPPARAGMVGVGAPGADKLLIFGGEGYVNLNDTWTYTASSLHWTQVRTVRAPVPLLFPSGCASNGEVLLFGGLPPGGGGPFRETWNLSWPTGAWANWTNDSASSSLVPAREQAGMVTLGAGNTAILYGGLNGTTYLGDEWEVNLTSFVWSAVPTHAPGARAHGSFAPVGPLPQALLYLGGLTPASTSTSAAALFAGALPAPSPTLRSGGVLGPIVQGSVWRVWANASEAGGFAVASVDLLYVSPGGGGAVSSQLAFVSGVSSGGVDLSGNWTGTLPPVATNGSLTWTLQVVSSGGSQTNLSGGAYVQPVPRAPSELQGFVYEATSANGTIGPPPLSGATVVAVGWSTGNTTSTVTGSTGAFSLPLSAGRYNVTASDAGHGLQTLTLVLQMGWGPSDLVFFLPSVQGLVPNFNGTVGICGDPGTRLVNAQVFVNSSTYQAHAVTNDSGEFGVSLQPGVYNSTFTYGGFGDAFFNFSLAAQGPGAWVENATCLKPFNLNLAVSVTFNPSPPEPHPGDVVNLTITIVHGGTTPVASGWLNLSMRYGQTYVSPDQLTPGGVHFLGGTVSVQFQVPLNVKSHTNITVGALIDSPGLPQVAASSTIQVVAAFPPPSGPPLWQTALPYVALAAVLVVLLVVVARRWNPSRIEEIFLVYKGGKLVWHASRTARADLEPEVVTGMLQAIEGFVERSFSPEGGQLNVLDFANMRLHIVRGHRLVAACLLSGRSPKETLRQVSAALEDMENAWKEPLLEWDGTTGSLPHLRAYVDALLGGFYRRHARLKAFDVDVKKLAD